MKQILFNTDMVRAILDGRKTVTRRVVKPQPKAALYPMPDSMCWPGCFANCEEEMVYRPPFQPGDILWVRETWLGWYAPHGELVYFYKATDPCASRAPTGPEYDAECEVRNWHPSIHMPREAARIFLRVTGVRVERLQEISYADVIAEGVPYGHAEYTKFRSVWNSTIKPKDLPVYGWDANPWVWVINFERISKEEAELEQ